MYGIDDGMSYEQFRRTVPVVTYEDVRDWHLRSLGGEQGLLWPQEIRWFAKSSGTTDAASKYIPVTHDGLQQAHLQGPVDVMAIYMSNFPSSNVLSGKILTLGGSKRIEREGTGVFSGDLSAILIGNTPFWARLRRCPPPEVALIPDFEQKLEAIYNCCVNERVTSFAGVPSWNLVLMRYIAERAGCSPLELWPDMELFVHGGVNFGPYRAEYERLFPSPAMHYMDTYNASEGFFAIEDVPGGGDMLLMLDYGQFYEFLPVDSLDDRSRAVPLEDVRTGVDYALIVTSCNGLWRYMLGDTVRFASTSPYRLRITGRTRHFINAFGEEVVVENVERAVAAAVETTGALVADYTVAPLYMEAGEKGAHEWIVEFVVEPNSRAEFISVIDNTIRSLNSDYAAKRHGDVTLRAPVLRVVPDGTFHRWLASQGRLGGQNKVPRLSNDRRIAEEIVKIQLFGA
jgi:hypothetical protein